MRHITLAIPALLTLLVACSTPYNGPVVVRDSTPFPGIANVIAQDPARPVDVFMVHGMCTHDSRWALSTMNTLVASIDANYRPKPLAQQAQAAGQIEVVQRTDQVGGGTVRFHALVWSPLVAQLKQQLAYDNTGKPTDCTKDGECKPKRAYYNGKLKDWLLNDCLSDAMIYQGQSQPLIRKAMVETLTRLLEESERRDDKAVRPLIVVAESMGSKIMFDALTDMMRPQAPVRMQELALRASRRMAMVFMVGNQLPILGLADQRIDQQAAAPHHADALQRFLELRRAQQRVPNSDAISKLAVVAFTDPNDMFAYRLLPTRYRAPDVDIADVLVSNAPTWMGMLANPFDAHLDYLHNSGVGGIVACGWPRSTACR